ncbi:MAG: tetratricopeptide repeat protein [Arenimonas sp.]
MIAAILLPLLLAVGSPVITTTVDGKEKVTASVVAADEDTEAARSKRLNEIHKLSRSGHAAEALPQVEALIAEYEANYPPGATRWYVARDMGESLAYSLLGTIGLDGSGHTTAQILTGVAWADAYFVQGWVLVELHRTDEARAALDHALELAPYTSEYLIERAEVSKLERKWDEAMRDFTQAMDFVTFSPEDDQKGVKAQAMRGQAFVHVERNELDAAEKVLRAVLKIDAKDARALEELKYVESLRKP